MPPSSSARPTLSQPPSSSARIDFLKAAGSVTVWVSGSKTGGLRSAVGERLGERPLGQPGDLGEHLAGRFLVQVGELAGAERLVDAEYLEQVEYLVTDVALVVAHDFSSMRFRLRLGTWD